MSPQPHFSPTATQYPTFGVVTSRSPREGMCPVCSNKYQYGMKSLYMQANIYRQPQKIACKKAAAAVDASRRPAMKSSCKPLSSICTVEECCATGKQLIKACRGAPRYSHAGQLSSTCCAHAWTPCYLAPQKLGHMQSCLSWLADPSDGCHASIYLEVLQHSCKHVRAACFLNVVLLDVAPFG